MKKLILTVLTLCTLMFAMNSCTEVEGEIVNKDVSLSWTAPGDDAMVGLADLYSMKYSTSLDSLINNYAVLPSIAGLPTPGNPFSKDSVLFNINLETGVKYFFAMKTADEVQPKTFDNLGTPVLNDYHYEVVGVDTLPLSFTHLTGSVSEGRNWSMLSNPVQIFLIDKETPVRVTDLSGGVIN